MKIKILNVILLVLICASGFAQNVGIGTPTPLSKLHIFSGASGFASTPFSPLVVEGNINSYINLLTPNGNENGILFGKADNAASGGIIYNNSGNANGFQFRTNGNLTRMVIDNVGNVGIGTSAPSAPLSFSNTLGNKMVFWGNGATAHYGLGVQSGMLELYADIANTNIGFGFGNSGAFTERMRIQNSGIDGMILNGRILLKNGTPADPTSGSGVYMYKPDNSGLLGFMGVQNNQNIGFFGGPLGWGFTYDAVNSRIGIGNNNPNSPLTFAASLGKKITLFPGSVGDAGLGMAGNRLQIYADNPNADVAIGYDVAGTFNERFALKPTGAFAVNGNSGTDGQVMISHGSASPIQWTDFLKVYKSNVSSVLFTDGEAASWKAFTAGELSFTNSQNSTLVISVWISVKNLIAACPLIGSCSSTLSAKIFVDGIEVPVSNWGISTYVEGNWDNTSILPIMNIPYNVGPGSHTLQVQVNRGGVTFYTEASLHYATVMVMPR